MHCSVASAGASAGALAGAADGDGIELVQYANVPKVCSKLVDFYYF